jgi:hypothetical protein
MTNNLVVNTPGGLISLQSAGIENGDVILNLNTLGGVVSYKSGTISPGDDVLVVPTPAGLVAVTDGGSESSTGLQPSETPPVGPPLAPPSNCILYCLGFDRAVRFDGESCNLGTLNFTWDGTGEIYLAGNCSNGDIWADNWINIGGIIRVSSQGTPYVWSGSSVDITSLLSAGNNNLDIIVYDGYPLASTASPGNLIGCSPLYLVQIGGSGVGLVSYGKSASSCSNGGGPPQPGMGYLGNKGP